MRRLLKNAMIMLPERKFIVGSLLIDGEYIAAINPSDAAADEVLDLGKHLIMPGLVNCHCHAPMTLLRGVGGSLPLQRWLNEAIFPREAKLTDEDIRRGMNLGIDEMLCGGITCFADMYEHSIAGREVLLKRKIKCNTCRPGLAFSETAEEPPHRLEECIEFVKDFHHERVIADICIHSEYLTNEKFCRALAAANRDLKRPLHVHVSETRKEHEDCIKRHGKTPIAYIASTGLFDYGGYAAHCVWASDDDFRIMRDYGVSLVHNPTSNMKLASGFARIVEARELGVNVALGTDGCASNDNLNMFEEMHLCSLIHKAVYRNPAVLPPWEVIEMATINGAKALGRDDTGVIKPGKKADLCIINLDKPHLAPCNDLTSLIVHSMQAADVAMTIVNGEIAWNCRASS